MFNRSKARMDKWRGSLGRIQSASVVLTWIAHDP